MNNNNKNYLIALVSFPKFGTKSIKKLKNYFQNYEKAYTANISEIIKAGIREKTAIEFINFREKTSIDKIINELNRNEIKTVAYFEKLYPQILKEIIDPPPLLFCRGQIIADEYCLGIVGSRKHTSYGQICTDTIVNELTNNQLTIVSGLAHGIDTIAHKRTLENKGRTIAVLGTGIDDESIYPHSNKNLAHQIINNNGLIMSEFPIKTSPLRHHFPLRNRIISGLSLGILVVEAAQKSGALITAYSALEQNREVFAIPGNIYSPASIGPNNLIKAGAKMVLRGEDILEELNLKNINNFVKNKNIIPESKEEKNILQHLSHEPIHIDEISRKSKINSAVLSSILIMMEMKGMVKNVGGMEYVLSR